ncbi:uncharacterized protein LOC121741539 [Salvia splendens]|uniref:uncharacterized protein LOC121741539 n=1 Tax=Salvia splendens TaxID=180675 RepID=UPI001C25DD4D|nr:uncharacterized protein LOC121741539 [Salvia splendens]XP_041990286.1 uncharacterized protein LOC121741539 [Salvia splendens]
MSSPASSSISWASGISSPTSSSLSKSANFKRLPFSKFWSIGQFGSVYIHVIDLLGPIIFIIVSLDDILFPFISLQYLREFSLNIPSLFCIFSSITRSDFSLYTLIIRDFSLYIPTFFTNFILTNTLTSPITATLILNNPFSADSPSPSLSFPAPSTPSSLSVSTSLFSSSHASPSFHTPSSHVLMGGTVCVTNWGSSWADGIIGVTSEIRVPDGVLGVSFWVEMALHVTVFVRVAGRGGIFIGARLEAASSFLSSSTSRANISLAFALVPNFIINSFIICSRSDSSTDGGTVVEGIAAEIVVSVPLVPGCSVVALDDEVATASV